MQVLVTDKNGQAVFSQLPTNRSISVTVDGKVQGYTLRTSQSGSTMAASFTAEGTGSVDPSYGIKPLDVYVRNQEGVGIEGKEVSLKDKNGNLISTLKSDENGLVHFTDKLMEGTYYSHYIGDQKYGETMPGISGSIYLDDSKIVENFTFTANILGKDGNTVSGKSVELYDITDSNPIKVSTLVSDSNGQAVFDGLALNRNYSVSVDGKNQGNTIRSSQAGTKKAATFFVEENGNQMPTNSTIPISVAIRNEDGEGISNQVVTLSNKQGKVVAELLSDKDGKATFSDNLMEGTFYTVKVNGVAMEELMPGNDVSIYLTNEQIQKNKTKILLII